MIDRETLARMREDWNARAEEDANFYVAFGRRGQDSEEFFATGNEVVLGIEAELKRLPPAPTRSRRALEIGCGPGRLIRPLSRRFGEIHGIDVSDAMIERARQNLAGIPHAHAHHGSGSNLHQFADSSFDLVYSYAVFQHIPSRDVVLEYLDEAVRVLKPGGILRCQINGLPESAARYDTWSGVRFTAEDMRDFARLQGMKMFALEGSGTQYMWITLGKPLPASGAPSGEFRIRRVTCAHSSEPLVPQRGRFAALSLWVESLPTDSDLLSLQAWVDGQAAIPTYLGPPESDGLRQLNLMLPDTVGTGLRPLGLKVPGKAHAAASQVRVIPAPPLIPRILSATDGINILAGRRIETGSVKVTIEECVEVSALRVRVDGQLLAGLDIFCVDPLPPRYEINFRLPQLLQSVKPLIQIDLFDRKIAEFELEVISS